MSTVWLIACVIAIALAGFFAGRMRALSSAGDNRRALHSLPNYYGWNVALKVMTPALGLLVIWLVAQPLWLSTTLANNFPEGAVAEDTSLSLVMTDVRRVAEGLDRAVAQGVMSEAETGTIRAETTNVREVLAEAGVALGSDVSPEVLRSAQDYRALASTGNLWRSIAIIGVALLGLGWALRETSASFRARNTVEQGVLAILVFAASIAILTTIGIVLSLIFNTVEFFRLYPALEFFTLLEWAPSFSGRGGASSLGILPLLWGTLYISFVALLVAVPIGIFAAVYLSEYASPTVRSIAKPMLEVLAGIPTIVYGLFALLTVGPLLMSVFGDDGLGWMQGQRAVITAGIAMGIMLIPFVSSLSDDIINAVPQSLRDGSYGLGATQSETIRQVVLPAALPGIVGAILLAASRAIGETMIVVLGAGAAARLSLNPFEAMTTVTAKIVSQLTGDSDFASPEALVAFALGVTLFVITLGLNVLALGIVRKYREQYE
ncbi:MAG: phosphate ABC transporter permease subunit PstC [Paracoccaceae bacterium]|nr:phosphate ABC transporter permease subunit PstC [Paracoccaceae bacterium]